MTAKPKSFEVFSAETKALHRPGLEKFGKRYKQHSNNALTSAFFSLIDHFSVSSAIEIGAFKGEFSRRFIHDGVHRTAIAVEANPYNFNEYQHELESAGVIYHHAAVLDRVGPCSLQLSVTERDVKNGYIRGNNSIRDNRGRVETRALTVPGKTLDSIVAEYVQSRELTDPSLSSPVLWIDVEGALDLVIKGGQQTVRNSLAIIAEVETEDFWKGQSTFPEICSQLDESGFFPFLRDCEYEPEQFNVIYVNQRLAGESILDELSASYINELHQFR